MTEHRLPDTFGQAAPILIEVGRVPLPLKELKAPAPHDWARWRDHPETVDWPEIIAAYAETPLTGMALVETDLVVDIDDEDRADEIAAIAFDVLGPTEAIRWGRRPRRQLFYSMPQGLPKHLPGITRNLAAVQLMTVGQQVAVAGPHPKTGEAFAWVSENGLPWATTPPETDVNALSRFHDAVRALLPAPTHAAPGNNLPAGLTSFYRQRCPVVGPVRALQEAFIRVEEGERHYSLVALIGSAITRGLSDEEIVGAVWIGTAGWTWPEGEVESEMERILSDLRTKDALRPTKASGIVITGPRGPKTSLLERRRRR